MTSAGTSVEYPHMATAAPHVKLLRQLASAKDDYLSGAFDISWDGAKATLYLVFGRPSHAVFDTDHAQIEGEAAIDALLAELPRAFTVSDWRRAMSPQETLSITIDELAGPFVRLAGSYADDPVTEVAPEWWSADDSSPELAFGLADFPLLPGGRPLWSETSPEDVNLAERLAELPPSVLTLTGAKLRAAAVVSGGDLIDAVWIDADDQARGEAAGMAILGATKGTLAGYALDDPSTAEALPMLWRVPLVISDLELAWLDPASMFAAFEADGMDRVLLIDAPVRGVALFSRGGLVAVYSETQRSAVASPDRLQSLLSQPRGRLTVMARKPRPRAAEGTVTAPTATQFFEAFTYEAVPDNGVQSGSADQPEVAFSTAVDTETSSDADIAAVGAAASGDADIAAMEPESNSDASVAGATLESSEDAAAPPTPPIATESESAPGAEVPVPAAPASTSEAQPTSRRSWWPFGRSRRSRAAVSPPQDEEQPDDEGDAPTPAGWNIRQADESPRRPWYQGTDHEDPSQDVGSDAERSLVAAKGTPDEAAAPAPGAGWSIVEPGTAPAPAAAAAADESDAETTTPPLEPPTAAGAEAMAAMDTVQALTPVDEFSLTYEPVGGVGAGGELACADEIGVSTGPDAALEPFLEHLSESDDTTPDLWAEFATPDLDRESEQVAGEPETQAETAEEPAPPAPLVTEPFKRGFSRPTVAPWSWPLAEAESQPARRDAGTSASTAAATPPPATAGTTSAPATDEPEPGFNQAFFQRDEPTGSKFVDFDDVRKELVRIGVVWLGESDAEPVTALLSRTRSTIDDFVATIDIIRGLHLEGQDAASIQAMAREMHQQAAERLSGA
jgi:hypothetical protein